MCSYIRTTRTEKLFHLVLRFLCCTGMGVGPKPRKFQYSLEIGGCLLAACGLLFSLIALGLDDWVGIRFEQYNDPSGEIQLENDYRTFLNSSASEPPSYIWIKKLPSIIPSRIGQFSECHQLVTDLPLYYRPSPQVKRFDCETQSEGRATFTCPKVALNSDPAARHPPAFDYETSLCPHPETAKCDGFKDCDSGLDEADCPIPEFRPGPSYTSCNNSKTLFIERITICNGYSNCGMDVDEIQCCDKPGTIRCANEVCVTGAKCDGRVDCFDQSDEFQCTNNDDRFMQCSNGQRIPKNQVCNGYFDCFDGSDETNCEKHNSQLNAPNGDNSQPFVVSRDFNSDTNCFTTRYDFETNDQEAIARLEDLEYKYGRSKEGLIKLVYTTSYRLIFISIHLLGVFLGFAIFIFFVSIVTMSLTGRKVNYPIIVSALIMSLLNFFAYVGLICGWATYCSAVKELYDISQATGEQKGTLERAFHYMKHPGLYWQSSLCLLTAAAIFLAIVVLCTIALLLVKKRDSYGSISDSEDTSEQLNPS